MALRPVAVRFLKTTGLHAPIKGIGPRWKAAQEQLEVWRNIPRRAGYILRYYRRRMKPAWQHLLTSRELSNFTYDLTDRGKIHFAHAVAIAAGCSATRAHGYIDELANDDALRSMIVTYVATSSGRLVTDARADYGKRLGWYALARALKPQLIVETGVDKGLGSVVLCAALRRNAAEGHPGRYLGTDINPSAGELLRGPYAEFGTVLHGDSIASLQQIGQPIDMFINDSDHSAEYERREYEVIATKLSDGAVIVGDNAHVTDELSRFAEATGRRFIAVQELPEAHWYAGAITGLAFR